MKKTILKLAVIASSVLLAAGFISYRAGAFNWLAAERIQPVDNTESASAPTQAPIIMSGSKSSFPATSISGLEAVPPNSTSPIIMSGSKSLAPLIPPSSSKPATQAPAQTQSANPAQK